MEYIDLLNILLGLIIGNFVVQYFGKKDWREAFKISYFQSIPILLIAVLHVN